MICNLLSSVCLVLPIINQIVNNTKELLSSEFSVRFLWNSRFVLLEHWERIEIILVRKQIFTLLIHLISWTSSVKWSLVDCWSTLFDMKWRFEIDHTSPLSSSIISGVLIWSIVLIATYNLRLYLPNMIFLLFRVV